MRAEVATGQFDSNELSETHRRALHCDQVKISNVQVLTHRKQPSYVYAKELAFRAILYSGYHVSQLTKDKVSVHTGPLIYRTSPGYQSCAQ